MADAVTRRATRRVVNKAVMDALPLAVMNMLRENQMRNDEIHQTFDPLTGEGSILDRRKVTIRDFPIKVQYLPEEMFSYPMVRDLVEAGSIRKYLKELGAPYNDENRASVIDQFTRIRIRCDFVFWCFLYVIIKGKGLDGEESDVHFSLRRPQRRLVERFERRRLQGKPIRLILLKARQWGGSTATQMYIAWLQLVHREGLNSLIIGHVKDVSTEIKDMYDKMIAEYPLELLYELGQAYNAKEPKMVGVGQTGNIHRVPQRKCKIKIGTAEKPDSCRGGDYNLVHCTEVGLWKKTDGKTPQQIVRSACSGITMKPYTMIVYESTANGTGNFFHKEYVAAVAGRSQFEAMFVAWYQIEGLYELPVDDLANFALELYKNRNNESTASDREEPGRYLWYLWESGATLEAIAWYIEERKKYDNHGDMASEFPSDDVEAFVHSGSKVFDQYKVKTFESACRAPRFIGDVYADVDTGKKALQNVRFTEDGTGLFWIWQKPEVFEDEIITNRYLVVVDIGGRSKKADWSVILVLDRYWMMEGGEPEVVAQWYGHIDMDLLAWKAAQIAAYYNNALLVIESNTLETKDKDRRVDGDQSEFILNQLKNAGYDNLYARKQSEQEVIDKAPLKYGFHTNVATKPMVISTLVKCIREHLYIERDDRCLHEYLVYEQKQNGAYGAIQGEHDDLLMTRAIGLHICFFEMPRPAVVKRKKSQRMHQKKMVSEATII